MKTITLQMILPVITLLILSVAGTAQGSEKSNWKTSMTVEFHTAQGIITIALYPDQAPISVNHFVQLVNNGTFNNSSFYRAVRQDNTPTFEMRSGERVAIKQGGIIQGGIGEEQVIPISIDHESTLQTGLKHVDGSLSWGRPNNGRASTEFFICVGEQPQYNAPSPVNLDGQGYAVFGQVIQGMEIVKKIHQQATQGQMTEEIILNRQQLLAANTLSDDVQRLLNSNKLIQVVTINAVKALPNSQ